MRSFKIGEHFLYAASGYHSYPYGYADAEWDFTTFLRLVFLRRRLFRELVQKVTQGRPTYKILLADGGTVGGQWCIQDGCKLWSLQKWVRTHDKTRDVLLIGSCNPDNLSLISQHAVLIHPSKIASWMSGMRGKAGMRIFIPGFGYCFTHYQLRKAMASFGS